MAHHSIWLLLFLVGYQCEGVQSIMSTHTDKVKLIGEGDPVSYMCDQPTTTWYIEGENGEFEMVAKCKECPSIMCDIEEDFRNRLSVSCSEDHSFLRVNSTRITDDNKWTKCEINNTSGDNRHHPDSYLLRVGSFDGHLRAENNSIPCVANRGDCIIVCDKEFHDEDIGFHTNEAEYRFGFYACSTMHFIDYGKENIYFTCDREERNIILHVTNVTMKDDGRVFGCGYYHRNEVLSLYRLKVNDSIPDDNTSDVKTLHVSNHLTTRFIPTSSTPLTPGTSSTTVNQTSVSQNASNQITVIILSCVITTLVIIIIVCWIIRK